MFLAIYILEAALKLMGLGFQQYWRSRFNRFDLLIVLGSIAMLFMEAENPCERSGSSSSSGAGGGDAFSLGRVLRVVRVFRLVSVMPNLRKIFETLLISLGSLINVGSLLVVLYFVYASWA